MKETKKKDLKKAIQKKKSKPEIDYSGVKFSDLPTCKDGTPRKKEFVLWIIAKINETIPKNKRTL